MSVNYSYLGDNINFKNIIKTLLKNIRLILLVMAVVIILTLVLSMRIPNYYRASTLVILSEPMMEFTFDTNIQPINSGIPNYQAIPEIVSADSLLQQLYELIKVNEEIQISYEDFIDTLSASMESPEFLKLEVRFNNPTSASIVANLWADLAIERLNGIYNRSNVALNNLREQSDLAFQEWTTSEENLLNFLSNNQVDVLTTQRNRLLAQIENTINRRTYMDILIIDIQLLRQKFSSLNSAQLLQLQDILSLILLQQKVLGLNQNIEIQFDLNQLSDIQITAEEATSDLEDLEASIVAVTSQYEDLIADYSEQTHELLTLIEEGENSEIKFKADRDLMQQKYISLVSQAEELQISITINDVTAKVVSESIPVKQSTKPSTLIMIILALPTGLIIGATITLAKEWWKED